MATYTTSSGDTWDVISKKYYSAENYSYLIIDANPKQVNTVFFSAGVVLNMPEIDTTAQNNTNLAPWKR